MYSRVVTPERTIEGTYFRSDEQMNHYMVSNSQGSFLAEDLEGESADTTSSKPASANKDTIAPKDTKTLKQKSQP